MAIIINNKNLKHSITAKPNDTTRKALRQEEIKRNHERQIPLKEAAAKQRKRPVSVPLPSFMAEEIKAYAGNCGLTVSKLIENWFWDNIEPYKNLKDRTERPREYGFIVKEPLTELNLSLPGAIINGINAYGKNHKRTLRLMLEDFYWDELEITDSNTTQS